ncbi:MAG: hypothetical protein AB7G25_16145 [Sphingomonadaceae bacterium]
METAPTEWELLAEAHRLRREHGDKVLYFVADQIGESLLAGDEHGVRHWRAVEDVLRKLRRGGSLH